MDYMLERLFRPRSVAVIGASNNPFSIGNIVIRNLAEHGFKGPIYPINPSSEHIRCFRAYKSVLDVPGEIDLVNISIAAKFLPSLMEECGKKGVKFAIVHSAGFKEVGEDGLKLQNLMVETANKYGIRIFGPNSQGIQNSDPEVSVYANFTFVPMKPGGISIIAQSGGCGEMLKLHLHNVGVGHRLYCSYGNESDLTLPELIEYYGKDDGTKVIMIQVESFKNPSHFLEVVSKIAPNKPVLAFKSGKTKEGSIAVSSHTGSLVDQAALASAMFRKAGIVEFEDTDEMIKTAIALERQTPPKGKQIGLITNTGGPGVQAVDEAVRRGLKLAVWSEAGKARLKETQLPIASLGNPVDVVATAGPNEYRAAIDTLLKEDGVDMVFVFFVTAPFVDLDTIATRMKEVISSSKKPVVVVIETDQKCYHLIDKLRAGNIPVYEFPEDGVRVLANMAKYAELRDRPKEELPKFEVDATRARDILQGYAGKNGYLSQVDAFELLKLYGVAVPKIAKVADPTDLPAASKTVGFPCVLKVDCEEVVHKSDEGGVALNIKDESELKAAFAKMFDKFSGKKANFVVQEQKAAGCEVIIGSSHTEGLGALVMFGLGGVFVEVMKDVVFSVAPLSNFEAREAITGIRGLSVLKGVRGKQGVDFNALEELLCRVSRLAADFKEIVEMDLNPVFAYPKGIAPAAVDVRIKVRL
jgi:acetyltransferase